MNEESKEHSEKHNQFDPFQIVYTDQSEYRSK